MSVISVFRCDGYRQAVDLLEQTGDEYLVKVLVESASLDTAGGHTLAGAVHRRLVTLYGGLSRGENLALITSAVDRQLASLPDVAKSASVQSGQDPMKIDWPLWLQVYRATLRELRGELGLPGHVFMKAVEVVLDDVSQRTLGVLPKSAPGL